jgi:hypothetical protein
VKQSITGILSKAAEDRNRCASGFGSDAKGDVKARNTYQGA